jgi:alkylation response protein AidB-like acyl-CoA dehydrogenase
MNFEYSEEQQQLADSVRKYLAGKYDFEGRKATINSTSGFNNSAWSTFAEMGLTAIALPEVDGGFGGGAVALMASMEACGEALVVEPLIDHIALAGRLISRAGSAKQRSSILPKMIDGSVKLACAYLERGARYDASPAVTVAKASAAGWELNGEKILVFGAALADHLVVTADAGGASLFLVDTKAPGVTLSNYRTVDGQRAADIDFRGVKLSADALLGDVGQAGELIDEALDFATALLCADAIGAMKYANDATLEYMKGRKQFGVPIASFQVLQHRLVDMYIVTEQARSMAILAASRVDASANATERKRAVSMAKIKIADAARQVSQEAIQLHGGMGMTEEMKVSHTFRRLTMIAQRFGDADHHLERFAALSS